jgi:hypothetical protein
LSFARGLSTRVLAWAHARSPERSGERQGIIGHRVTLSRFRAIQCLAQSEVFAMLLFLSNGDSTSSLSFMRKMCGGIGVRRVARRFAETRVIGWSRKRLGVPGARQGESVPWNVAVCCRHWYGMRNRLQLGLQFVRCHMTLSETLSYDNLYVITSIRAFGPFPLSGIVITKCSVTR